MSRYIPGDLNCLLNFYFCLNKIKKGKSLINEIYTTMAGINDNRIVIIGGGIIGCATALKLAENNNVVVLEEKQIASGATGLASGLIAPTLFYPNDPKLVNYVLSFFEEFDGEGQFEFTRRPRLELFPLEYEQEARSEAERLLENGYSVNFLSANLIKDRYPRLKVENYSGAIEYKNTGWVDPYSLTMAIKEKAEQFGVEFRTGVLASNLLVNDGEFQGVTTNNGKIPADKVVVAAGWKTENLLRDLITIPVRPYRTQDVVLKPNEPLNARFPLGRVPEEEIYFRPEHNGNLLVGGSSKIVDNPAAASTQADEAFRDEIASLIPNLISGFDRAGFVEGWAGIDAATPDGRAIIDNPKKSPDNLVIATGFNGLGIMTAPAAAAIVNSIINDSGDEFATSKFSLSRFDTDSTNFELHSTFDMSH